MAGVINVICLDSTFLAAAVYLHFSSHHHISLILQYWLDLVIYSLFVLPLRSIAHF